MKDNNIIPHVSVGNPDGKGVEIRFVDRNNAPPRWQLGSGARMNYMRIEPVDMFAVMAKLSPQEHYVLNVLKNDLLKVEWIFNSKTKKDEAKYYASSHVSYDASLLDINQKAKFKEGAKRLIAKKLLVREKRQHFMINPAFVVPSKYSAEENEWMLLNGLVDEEYTATSADEMIEDNGIK